MTQDNVFAAFDTAWNGSYDNTKESLDELVGSMKSYASLLSGDEQQGYVSAIQHLLKHYEDMDLKRQSSPKRNRCLRTYLQVLRLPT